MSGQWIPYPAPAMRQFARCSDVACSRRGYLPREPWWFVQKINTDCVVSDAHVPDSLTCFRFQSSHSMPPIIPSGALRWVFPISSVPLLETRDCTLKPQDWARTWLQRSPCQCAHVAARAGRDWRSRTSTVLFLRLVGTFSCFNGQKRGQHRMVTPLFWNVSSIMSSRSR